MQVTRLLSAARVGAVSLTLLIRGERYFPGPLSDTLRSQGGGRQSLVKSSLDIPGPVGQQCEFVYTYLQVH
ncbi:hypothetical protein OH76DRAFT_626270 [Lentinus brumalis]|uniref:Uncharacterized protein n=1 Tax=Lentinus brumalis TaxID=2498619 RepID=A0A371D879_9APHY|nr:hypothetical protein OH76DRAFT_626270 [Polyporus brumalis]